MQVPFLSFIYFIEMCVWIIYYCIIRWETTRVKMGLLVNNLGFNGSTHDNIKYQNKCLSILYL